MFVCQIGAPTIKKNPDLMYLDTALILLCVFTVSLFHTKDVLHDNAGKPHEISHLCYAQVEKEEKNHDHSTKYYLFPLQVLGKLFY